MTNPNDPAFPADKVTCQDGNLLVVDQHFGLTKREEFAKEFGKGLVSAIAGPGVSIDAKSVSEAAVLLADALIAELSKS